MSFTNRFRAARAPRSNSGTRRRRMAKPLLEPMEDRTLLASAWQNLATALNSATNPLISALGAAENGLNTVFQRSQRCW
jgi:hypothetical protein